MLSLSAGITILFRSLIHFYVIVITEGFFLLFLSHLLTHMIIIYYLLDILFSLLLQFWIGCCCCWLYSSTVRLKCRKSAPVHCDYMWSFSISEYEERKKNCCMHRHTQFYENRCTSTTLNVHPKVVDVHPLRLCVDLYMISLFIVLLVFFFSVSLLLTKTFDSIASSHHQNI